MNNVINSSGVYDINSYDSMLNNTTVLSTLNVSGSKDLIKLLLIIPCMFQDLQN